MALKDKEIEEMKATTRAIADRWSLLILWLANEGVSRFDLFQCKLGIARNILSNRLNRLVDEGFLYRVPVQGGKRLGYECTTKGRELYPMLESLLRSKRECV